MCMLDLSVHMCVLACACMCAYVCMLVYVHMHAYVGGVCTCVCGYT